MSFEHLDRQLLPTDACVERTGLGQERGRRSAQPCDLGGTIAKTMVEALTQLTLDEEADASGEQRDGQNDRHTSSDYDPRPKIVHAAQSR